MDVWAVLMALCALSTLLSWSWQYDRHHSASLCECTSSLVRALTLQLQVYASTIHCCLQPELSKQQPEALQSLPLNRWSLRKERNHRVTISHPTECARHSQHGSGRSSCHAQVASVSPCLTSLLMEACLQRLQQQGLWNKGGSRQKAGQVGSGRRARDGRHIGVSQPLQQQLQEGRAALLRPLRITVAMSAQSEGHDHPGVRL